MSPGRNAWGIPSFLGDTWVPFSSRTNGNHRATSAVLGSPLPIEWARTLSDEQREKLTDVIEDLSIWLRSDIARLWRTFSRADSVWLDAVLVSLQRRDDLECILWVLRQAEGKGSQGEDLAALDAAGRIFLATLNQWTAPGVDERLRRARTASPEGWWTAPAEWADPYAWDPTRVSVVAGP